MKALWTSALACGFLALVVHGSTACDEAAQPPCQIDTDCPLNGLCRDAVCINTDAGVTPIDSSTGGTQGQQCLIDGLTCTLPDECCSRTCTTGRCTSATSPPPQPTCKGQFELCQNDCCSGLTCRSGSCRP